MVISEKDPRGSQNVQGGPDPFTLIDEDRVEELRDVFRRSPKLLETENASNLTPLMHALLKKKFTIVKALCLLPISRFKDTVLIAVLVGDVKIVELVLANKKFDTAKESSVFFPAYMTPLMLAALCSHHAMVKSLLNMGNTLNIPHRPDCICLECCDAAVGKDWVSINCRRLHEYRALCSHSYLMQDCIADPILEAFMISRDLEKCQEQDSACADIYEEIANHVRKLPVAMLNCCRDDAELTMLLRRPEGAMTSLHTAFPRLSLAIGAKQKEFISDPRCLKILKKHWLGNWEDWDIGTPKTRFLRVVTHTILYPVSSTLYILTGGRFPKSYEIPFARFLTFTTSYLTFLMFLVMFTQYDEARTLRGAPVNNLKKAMLFYIWAYMLGMFVVSWTDLLRLGFHRFLYAWWRWYDFIQLITYFVAFNAYLVSWTLVRTHGEPFAHRIHWDPMHPTLIFEVTFTIAAVLSSWRLFYFLQIMRSFGPLVISIGRCVKDILIFLILFLVVVGSFALGLNFLIEHYKYNTVNRDGNVVEQPFFMTSIQSAVRYLYWAWYGYLDPERLEVIVGNYGLDMKEAKHMIVQYVAEFLSAFYYIILVIALLNLMISIMATTAGAILERKDQEWKFVCSQMWSEFFQDSRVLPPPFCLIHLMLNGSIWLMRKFTSFNTNLSIWNWKLVETAPTPEEDEQYANLIKTLRKRLLCRRAVEELMGQDFVSIYGLGTEPLMLISPDCH